MATRPVRRSVEVNLGMPADDDARLRREASWSIVELELAPGRSRSRRRRRTPANPAG